MFLNVARTVPSRLVRSVHLFQRRSFCSTLPLRCIADGGAGTHKPTPFQEKILVWTKTYKTVEDIPSRITRSQMRNAQDRFRVRCLILFMLFTAFSAAVVAMIGRRERLEHQSHLTKNNK